MKTAKMMDKAFIKFCIWLGCGDEPVWSDRTFTIYGNALLWTGILMGVGFVHLTGWLVTKLGAS